jgi:23S rRNA (adenine2030-N6)-methyltransferase
LVKHYLDCVQQINNELTNSHHASLRYYPGSPKLARYLIRPQDRIILCELQPEDYQLLRLTFSGDKQVAVHHLDGYLGLKAFLPPRENRGLVLIDPSYESSWSPVRKDSVDDFIRIIDSLSVALKRWEKGIYAIWYPIKEKSLVTRFYRSLRKKVTQPIFKIELTCYPDIPNHLNGSGVAIINPPWQFDQTMNQTLPWLWKALTINNQGGYATSFLK